MRDVADRARNLHGQARHGELRGWKLRESRYFWERNYGSSSFRVLLSRLPDLVEVKRDRSSSDMLVSLVAPRPAKTPADGGKAAPARRKRATSAASKQAVVP